MGVTVQDFQKFILEPKENYTDREGKQHSIWGLESFRAMQFVKDYRYVGGGSVQTGRTRRRNEFMARSVGKPNFIEGYIVTRFSILSQPGIQIFVTIYSIVTVLTMF